MATKQKNQERIVAAATDLFLRYGYSRVVIDDIARELAMSKKTIYNHFTNKSAILLACIDAFAERYRRETDQILKDVDLSLREKIQRFMQHTGLILKDITLEFKQDIKRNEPEAWAKYNTYVREITLTDLSQLFQEGVRVGYLRDEADGDLGILIYVAVVQQLNDPDFQLNFPQAKAMGVDNQRLLDKIISLLFHGLLSPKYID